ncbi:hypothetical protein [Caenimonas sp. SL110]|uniref:hypothetical protein n=1 Tax=Caenimonas sp. SL110 TaxID=1450524 RepID=UPI0006528AAD|nr:hypothetical protein [Caenimonas sp. SL110]
MQFLLAALMGLLAVDLLLVTIWIAVRLASDTATGSPAEVAPFFVAAGVFLALVSLLLNRRREASKDYLESATDLIEKAYEVLNDRDDAGRPKNSRINWLTSARLLRKSEQIARRITDRSHVQIWKEKLEYWRGKLHDLILPGNEGFPSSYYAEKPDHLYAWSDDVREPLSLKSLAVLYRFVRWPAGHEDPLKDDEGFTEDEIQKMAMFGPRGLGELLEDFHELRRKKEKK